MLEHIGITPIIVSTAVDVHRLAPAVGSRKSKRRIARGYGGKCGGTGGRGTRGQKSRSGGGVRPGFEGGQTPLYRRLPKLKGIAGGMSASVPRFVVVNLKDLEKITHDDENITLETLKNEKILSCTGKQRKLALKVLGAGSLSKPLNVKAGAFSDSAKLAIEAAGGTAEIVPNR